MHVSYLVKLVITSTEMGVILGDTMESFFLDLKEMSQHLEESKQLNTKLRQENQALNATLTNILHTLNGMFLCVLCLLLE